ncbi:MAG: beta strand repeat-containing protein [Phycisphaerae bacterium]
MPDNFVGGAGATNWSVATNWILLHPPAAGDDALVFFQDAASRTINLDINSNPIQLFDLSQSGTGTLIFQQSANTALTTDTTQIGDNGTATFNQSNGTHTTNNLNIQSPAGPVATYNLSSSGKIITPGNIRIGNFGNGAFTQSGSSSVTLTSSTAAISLGIGNGTGNYTLSGGSISTSTANCNLYIGFSSPGNFDQGGGAILFNNCAVTVGHLAGGAGNYTMNSGTLNTGNFTVGESALGQVTQNGGTATAITLSLGANPGANGLYTLNSTLNASNENIGISGNGAVYQNGGANTVGNTLALGANSGSTGSYSLFSGTLSALTENIGLNGAGYFTQNGGTNFISNSGALNIGTGFNSGTYTLNGGSLSLGTGATLTNSGTFTLSGGAVGSSGALFNNSLLTGFGSITVSGNLTNTGTINQTGGTLGLSVFGSFTNTGTINASLPGQLKLSGSLTNSGTINLNGGSLLPNGSAIITNNGLIVGPGTLAVPVSSFSTGIISVPAGATNITTPYTNAGLIALTAPTSLLVVSGFTSNGTIQGIGTLTSSTSFFNNGAIEPLGGTLAISAPFFNDVPATLRISAGNKLVITTGLANNNGLISLTGGTFDNNNFPLTNNGIIAGFGTLATGALFNNGNITFSGGLSTINGGVVNNPGQTINIKFNPAIFTGDVTNAGTLKTTSTTVTFAGTFTNSGSFLSDPATNIFSTLQNSGQISGGPGDVFTVSAFTNAGTFTNGGTLNANGNITNAGAFTQSGPQAWSSTASFTNTAGTAKFQSDAILAGLTITGGTVDITTTRFIVNHTDPSILSTYLRTASLTSSTLAANEGLALLDNGPGSTLITPALLGDTNLDNKVDLTDLSTLLNHFGTPTPLWSAGNFDHQSTIDLTDLSDLLNNFGATGAALPALPPTPAPEPAALLALMPFALRKVLGRAAAKSRAKNKSGRLLRRPPSYVNLA